MQTEQFIKEIESYIIGKVCEITKNVSIPQGGYHEFIESLTPRMREKVKNMVDLLVYVTIVQKEHERKYQIK